MATTANTTCDVLIIGGGVVGCAILRELAGAGLRVVLVEAASDLGQGISRANTAIAHTGFDAPPGTLEARLVTQAHAGFVALCSELGVDMRPCGALMVALDQADVARLSDYEHKAALNGIAVTRVGPAELRARWPYLNPAALGGLHIPGEMPIDSFALTLAYAQAATQAGATIWLDEQVIAIEQAEASVYVTTTRQAIQARFVVNAAGLAAAQIAHMVGDRSFDIRPRKGQLVVIDPASAPPIEVILLPTPSPTTKGILITPAAHGNLLLGPTAEDGVAGDDWSTSADGIAQVLQGVQRLVPTLHVTQPITHYAGLRSVGYEYVDGAYVPAHDYIVRPAAGCPRLIHVAGIRSTGLSASPALAHYVAELLVAQGLEQAPDPTQTYTSPQPAPADPGQVVCICSGVCVGQIQAAIHGPVPARTLDALKRRLWTMAGACQGTWCIAPLVQILADQLGCDLSEVRKHAPGSELVLAAPVMLPRHPNPPFAKPTYAARYAVVVVGAGPAGMAAARAASNTGAGVLLVDLADRLGGALVAMGIDAEATSELASAIQHNPRVQLALQTALIGVRGDLVQLHGPAGMWEVRADTLVVATGGREPTRGSLLIPGTRPAGVLTAGAALRLLTATGRLPGANVVLAGQGVWAAQVTERLAAAGASVTQVHDSIADIQGWPRISEVRLNSGQQIACDLLVLAEPPVPWETTDLTGASIQILFAGAIALGACDDTRAAAHGAEVGVWAATGVPLG